MSNDTRLLLLVIANRGWKNGRLVEFAKDVLKTGKFNLFRYVERSMRKKLLGVL